MAEVPRGRLHRRMVIILVVVLAAGLSVGLVCAMRYGYRLMQERWLKSDSGQVYTPGGAAKKIIEKIKE